MADNHLAVDEALELEDAGALREQEGVWRRAATAYWMQQAGKSSAQKADAPPRRHRAKALAWLTALDHQLVVSTGGGLKEFQLDACVESRPEPGHWPLIVVALDQGSDGWAGVHFLSRAARVNIMYLHDASHRLWNDVLLSLKSVGAWPAVLLLQLCFNMEHGPWDDARWFAQLREGAASYVALASPERDELFVGLLPLILADSGDADMVCDKDFTTELFHNLPSCCKIMQQKVGMSRWFGIVDAASSFLPVWHSRLLVQTYLCLQMGIDLAGAGTAMMDSVTLSSASSSTDPARCSTAQDSEDVRKLRSACRNALHFATLVLGDADMHAMARLLPAVVAPLRSWQTEQSKTLRSCSDSAEWYMRQAAGVGFEALDLVSRTSAAAHTARTRHIAKTNIELTSRVVCRRFARLKNASVMPMCLPSRLG